jgi:1-acyl-sn-glycerol-3-phosphate acyltransferase
MAAIAFSPPLWPLSPSPLALSQGLLQLLGTQVRVVQQAPIPTKVPLIVVSNHRSILDAPVLMAALKQDIAFVCHPYMANVPFLREAITHFGAFPLAAPQQRHHSFFQQATRHLQQGKALGIFPEGAMPMVKLLPPTALSPFNRGFAHLALRAAVDDLALIPVALVSDEPGFESPIPLKLLSWFDPSEPLFQQAGGHPVVVYRQAEVRVGAPIWVTAGDRQAYRERSGRSLAHQLTQACQGCIQQLMQGQAL